MDYKLLNFLGINPWIAKQSLLPFDFEQLYFRPACLAILPISKQVLSKRSSYEQIKSLYFKMLAVLELSVENLLKSIMHYENQVFSISDKEILTLKLLPFAPKIVITFGNLDFLDQDLLHTQKILGKKILHPEHLLNHPQDKRIAYQDLLACKKQLIVT